MRNRTPLGLMFVVTLVLSWTLVTIVIGLAMWSERDASPMRLATWGSLWLFSVLMPTLNALTVQRALDGTTGGSAADLARLRSLLLLTANMTVLSAFALILDR